jgi:ethylbenzene dioxygenase ferredoxin subunit
MERHLVVCPLAELAPGEMRRVDPPENAPILVCNLNGELWAVDDTCTHSRASLSEGELEGDEVFCPVHWGKFYVPTGRARGFPAEQDLRTWPVGVQDEMIVVELGEG